MFKNLMDFSFKRSWKEALGFYLAYLVLGIIIGMVLAGMSVWFIPSSSTGGADGFSVGLHIGAATSIVFCLVIAFLILKQRRLYKNYLFVVLAVLTGIMAFFGGAILGLLIPAFLTTRE